MKNQKKLICVFLTLLYFLISSNLLSNEKHNVTITQFEVNKLPQFSLYVSVTDELGKPVKLNDQTLSLEENLVTLFEDGQSVTINEIQPVLELEESELSKFYIALVLDNSASMAPFIEDANKAADLFIDQMRDKDKIAIVEFDPKQNPFRAKVVQSFTNIKYVLKKHTKLTHLTQRTFLYDATYLACNVLVEEKTLGRKAVVVLSDGADIGSKTNYNEVIEFAQLSDIPIYTIDFNREGRNRNLKGLSEKTNGKYFRATKAYELAQLYDAILEQLKGQYRITYTTGNEDWAKPVRNLRVDISLENNIFSAQRDYAPDVAHLQYLALRYKEAVDKVSSDDYLNYLNTYSNSEWSDDIQFRLGVHYEQRGFIDKANEIYDYLISMPQTEWKDEVLFRKGKIYENSGDYANAIETYKNVANNYPNAKDAPNALLGMARSYRQSYDMVNAELTYSRIKDDYSGSEVTDEALLELSDLKIKQRKTAEAKDYLLEIVNNYKESNSTSQAYFNLASLAEEQGNLGEAIVYCDKAAQSGDNATIVSRSLSKKGDLLFNIGDFNSAIKSYEIVVSQYETDGYKDEALLGLSKSYRKQTNYSEMRNCFDQIKEMKSLNQDVSFNLDEVSDITQVIAPNSVKKVTNLTGAALETIPNNEITYPLEVSIKQVPKPDHVRNLSIAGDIYDFKASTNTFSKPVRISLPYDTSWIDTTDKRLENFKLYTYENSKWELIPECRADTNQKVIYADVTSLSLKTIMFQPPLVIRFDDILFEFGKAEVTDASKLKVDTIATILKTKDKIRLEVQGHTDDIGTDENNLDLSQKRAKSIANYLITCGVDSARIIPQGYGEKFPIASNDSDDGRALNRRTEFVIISKGENDLIDAQQRQLGTKYTIQLGEGYKILSRATEWSEILKKEGFGVHIHHVLDSEPPVYQLWCGYFDNKEEAIIFAEKIVSQFVNLKYEIIVR